MFVFKIISCSTLIYIHFSTSDSSSSDIFLSVDKTGPKHLETDSTIVVSCSATGDMSMHVSFSLPLLDLFQCECVMF